MDGFKDVISSLTALVGLISALMPLFGFLADKKRRANALAEGRSKVLLIRPGPPWSVTGVWSYVRHRERMSGRNWRPNHPGVNR
jgi:hypothetical protein